jgi:hypothetical protein
LPEVPELQHPSLPTLSETGSQAPEGTVMQTV